MKFLSKRTDRQSHVGYCFRIRPKRKMILNRLWSTLFGAEKVDIIEEAPINSEEPGIQTSVSGPEDEIEVLARYCGGLAKGKVVRIGLHEILDIIPRKRRKADAYYALKKQLRDEYGVELVITSRASKKEGPGNGEE